MRLLGDLLGTLRTSFRIGRATISAASLTAARTVTLPDRSIAIGDVWEFIPIGMEIPIDSTTAGVDIPPTDNPNYRYIKLTASDSYNDGVLTSESVSGSAPLVQATAVISDVGSPLNGQTVRLINTERRVIRAGSSGTVEADAMQRITGDWSRMVSTVPPIRSDITIEPSGAFGRTAFSGSGPGGISFSQNGAGLTFDSSGSPGARTADETRPKSIGRDYYKRIR